MINNRTQAIAMGLTPSLRVDLSQNRRSNTDGVSFDSILADSRRQETPVVAPNRIERRPLEQSENRGEQNLENAVSESNAVQETPVAVAETEDAKISEEIEAALVDDMEDELLAEIAAILGIEPHVLTEIMAALGISLSQLGEVESQKEILVLIHGLEGEMDLLNIPEALPQMQDMSAAVEDFANLLSQYEGYLAHASEGLLGEQNEGDAADLDLGLMEGGLEQFEFSAESEAALSEADTVTTAATGGEATAAAIGEEAQITTEQINLPEPIPAFNQAVEMPHAQAVEQNIAVAEARAQVSPQAVMEQIVSSMRFEVQGTLSEIRIQLKPEHLGQVSLRIATQNGIVVAQFMAESQRVKEIIEAGFNQLRDALAEQGINIAQIEVSVSDGEAQREFSFGGNISSARIEELMAEDEETAEEPNLDDSTISYKI